MKNEWVLMALVKLSSAQKIGSDGVGAIGFGEEGFRVDNVCSAGVSVDGNAG
jgi:hypothetical protein